MNHKIVYPIVIVMGYMIGCNGTEIKQASTPPQSQAPSSSESAANKLETQLPNAKVHKQGDEIQRVYGVVAKGETPKAATDEFVKNSTVSFGVSSEEIVPVEKEKAVFANVTSAGPPKKNRQANTVTPKDNGIGLMYNPTTGKYKFRLYKYRQQRDGVPVYGAVLRTLVRVDDDAQVVWAGTSLKKLGDFIIDDATTAPLADEAKSLESAQSNATEHSLPVPNGLVNFSTPKTVIFAGVGATSQTPQTAMQYTAQGADGVGKWSFVANASTGDIVHIKSTIVGAINGTVTAEVITGPESMECGTKGVAPLPYARVSSSIGDEVFTDQNGVFNIETAGDDAIEITSEVSGRYFQIINQAGSTAALSNTALPFAESNFMHQQTSTSGQQLELAQYNAYKALNNLRDMLLFYVPNFPTISQEIEFPVNINSTDALCYGTGGAFYDNDNLPRSITLCQQLQLWANAAFDSVAHHEYGHHIIDSAGGLQSQYGEGMADTISMLYTKDPNIGFGHYHNDCIEPMRKATRLCKYVDDQYATCKNQDSTGAFYEETYFCSQHIYDCGAVLTGAFWDIWQNLDATNPQNSDDIIRSLVFNSLLMYIGNTISPSIVIDILVLDDDDGILENGTPHYPEICDGFEKHGLDCPPIENGLVVKGTKLSANGPVNGPFESDSITYTLVNLDNTNSAAYSVEILSGTGEDWLNVSPAMGTIAPGEQTTVVISIAQDSAANLPEGKYKSTIGFVNESLGSVIESYDAALRIGMQTPIFEATFDAGLEGFTLDGVQDNIWHQSSACMDVMPGHSGPGSLYYGIDSSCQYNTGNPVLHTITSPEIELATTEVVELEFNYYLRTDIMPGQPGMPDFPDEAKVEISINGGPFQIIASSWLSNQSLTFNKDWNKMRFDISHLFAAQAPATIRIQIGFSAGSIHNNTEVGFAIDDISVYTASKSLHNCTSDAQCDDGLYCNGVEFCYRAICLAGTPVTCDDGNPCTDDSCDNTLGCFTNNNEGTCYDDGDPCTIDVCQAGTCTHQNQASCSSNSPCANYCNNPVTFSSTSYQSGALGDSATCHETTVPISGGTCGNFDGSRQLSVNGVEMPCDWTSWTLPPTENGGYCITATSGGYDWAAFSTW